MERTEFWEIIERINAHEDKHGALKAELKLLNAQEIESYQDHFDAVFDCAYQWDLWGAAYLMHGGCSDDGFIDFRYGLIAMGQTVFEAALKDAGSLASLGPDVEIDDEAFGYIAGEVYKSRFDREMPTGVRNAPADPGGEEWDFDDEEENAARLPALVSLYD